MQPDLTQDGYSEHGVEKSFGNFGIIQPGQMPFVRYNQDPVKVVL
jgi:hypothetical protein